MHSIANRLIPERVGVRLTQRPPETKFPARYAGCTHRYLCLQLSFWASFSILPLYLDAEYLSFFGPLERLYLVYENAIARRPVPQCASHYYVEAVAET
jgi:hypothetical protein